jgi:hypothetical protein
MALFGRDRDFSLVKHINDELIKNIIQQEIEYYQIDLNSTKANMYGEAPEKTWYDPVYICGLLVRGDQDTPYDQFGMDKLQNIKFGFFKQHLIDLNLVPEKGDIIVWNTKYYEINSLKENRLFLGKDQQYSMTSDTNEFGGNVSIIVDTNMIRPEKLNLIKTRG